VGHGTDQVLSFTSTILWTSSPPGAGLVFGVWRWVFRVWCVSCVVFDLESEKLEHLLLDDFVLFDDFAQLSLVGPERCLGFGFRGLGFEVSGLGFWVRGVG
jgi:hypothetical protein